MSETVESDDMDKERETLCYFEYYDRRGSKNHLCLVCADCETLDEVADGCIRGRKPTDEQMNELKADVVDRLRIPAYGGARKLNINLFVPNLIIGSILFAGSLHILLTFATPILLNTFMVICYRKWRAGVVSSTMFFSWGPSCLCWLYMIAIIYEAPYCSTLCVAAVHALFAVFLLAMWRTRTMDPGLIAPRYKTKADNGILVAVPVGFCSQCGAIEMKRSKHCRFCKHCVRRYDHHCLWLNCCVAAGNHRWFLVTVVSLASLGFVFIALALHSECFMPTAPELDEWQFARGWQCWKGQVTELRSSVLMTTSLFVAMGTATVVIMFIQQVLMISADVTYHQSLKAQRKGHNFMWLLRRWTPLQILYHWKLFLTGWPNEDTLHSASNIHNV